MTAIYSSLTKAILDLSSDLISRKSITPDDKGCQEVIANLLKKAGFTITELNFDDTHNLWATHIGKASRPDPIVCLAGHTDVVPTGDLSKWQHDPFEPVIQEGYLYGRGAADMKASLAVQIISAIEFVKNNPNHNGTIAFLITSDEEGNAKNGTKKALEYIYQQNPNLIIQYALIGEPSSVNKLGDMIKIGRRGSLSGILTVSGIQGHVAYPHRALNPFHRISAVLTNLIKHEFDTGNQDFPPTSLQFTDIDFGVGADNVIPGSFTAKFNLRFSPIQTAESIQATFAQIFSQHQLNSEHYEIQWRLSGLPFYTKTNSKIVEVVQAAIQQITGNFPELSTTGGTSDGRFFALYDTGVVELGPLNDTIHQVNECVNIDDLIQLQKIYDCIFTKILFT